MYVVLLPLLASKDSMKPWHKRERPSSLYETIKRWFN